MSTYKFYFVHDNSSPIGFKTEVFPIYSDLKIDRRKEDNEVYFRREFSGKLTFIGADYLYLMGWYDTESYCFELLFQIYRICDNGDEILEFQGIVALNDFEYNLDRCKIELGSVATYDIYTLIDSIKDNKINILSYSEFFESTNYGEGLYQQSLSLIDIIEIFIGTLPTPFPGSGISLGGILLYSEFYQNSVNPVTKTGNFSYFFIQKSDFIRYSSGSPATIGEMSFGKYLEWLKNIHNVFLFADGDVIRIEHISFYKGGIDDYSRGDSISVDLVDGEYAFYNKSKRSFSYEKEKFPESEEWAFEDSNSSDFVGSPIIYKGACVKIGEKRRFSLDGLSVDIDYINSTTYTYLGDQKNDKVSFDGFVLVACFWGTGNIIYQNEPLKLTVILDTYHKFNRPLSSGIMNGIDTDFITYIRQRNQIPLVFPNCCETYISRNLIRNGNMLSDTFWERGDTTPTGSINVQFVDNSIRFYRLDPDTNSNKNAVRHNIGYIASLYTEYTIQFEVKNYGSGQLLAILFGQQVGFYTTDGIKTANISIGSSIDLVNNGYLKFIATPIGGNYQFDITGIRVFKHVNDIDELTLIKSELGNGEIDNLSLSVKTKMFTVDLKYY